VNPNPQSIRTPSARRKLPKQQFAAGKPLNFRQSVFCHAHELDLLAEAARAAGYGIKGIRRDTEERGGFFVSFVPVEVYRNQNAPKTQP
jgi:hypothetical protein